VRLAFFLAAGLAVAPRAAETPPLNLLVLYADDWRHDTLGCAGNPLAHTPNIDRLAAEGVRFTHAAVTTSICGVSRATLFTGQWMSRHGNRGFAMFQTPWAETWPAILREKGYWTGLVGKWHCGKFPAQGFDFGRAYSGRHWVPQPGGEPVHVTRLNERDALDFLRERPADRPFALKVSFFAPHAEDGNPRQYLPQPESLALFADATVPTPATATPEHLARLPPFLAADANEGRVRWRWRFDTPARFQEYMKNYLRLVAEVDAACGRVLDTLREQGLLDRTLVVFTTDNGYFHAEKGLADKWYPYEESIRVPLIVRDPRLPAARRGTTRPEFVLNADLAPFLLSAAGAPIPPGMQGRDFAPLYLASEPPPWREEFFYEHAMLTSRQRIPASQALVRRHEKYILYPEWDYEELFDLRADPREERDLARDPAHAHRLPALRARLAELRDQAARPGS
jgi:arylsulfatase A-like enzyme